MSHPSRTWSTETSEKSRALVSHLLDAAAAYDVEEYRDTMTNLGVELGRVIRRHQGGYRRRTLVLCTSEDADFLGRGVLQALSSETKRRRVLPSLACFWHSREQMYEGFDVAPITRRYVEDVRSFDRFVIVKSIISSSCVVRSIITEMVDRFEPRQIIVASPVRLKDATIQLEAEFSPRISNKFSYVWFAEDEEKTSSGEVVPGIGGMVYSLLGFDEGEETRYTPQIVVERRRELATGSRPR